MKIWDAIPDLAKQVAGATIILSTIAGCIVWIDALHTDAEAMQFREQQQSADACATVYQYELWIARYKAQLRTNIPEWRKAELEVLIDEYQKTVDRLRARYDC